MVYLVRLKIGYNDFYFQFDRLEAAALFVRTIKQNRVDQISDDHVRKETIEVLTEDEYYEKIEKTEGE